MKTKNKETEQLNTADSTEIAEQNKQNQQIEPIQQLEKAEEVKQSEQAAEEAKVWVYIGPTIRGIVTNGAVLSGTRSAVLAGLPCGYNNYPQIERLIVSAKDLINAKKQLAEKKGGITKAYEAVAAAVYGAAKEV